MRLSYCEHDAVLQVRKIYEARSYPHHTRTRHQPSSNPHPSLIQASSNPHSTLIQPSFNLHYPHHTRTRHPHLSSILTTLERGVCPVDSSFTPLIQPSFNPHYPHHTRTRRPVSGAWCRTSSREMTRTRRCGREAVPSRRNDSRTTCGIEAAARTSRTYAPSTPHSTLIQHSFNPHF